MQGQVVHFEVPFGDGDRARSFYRETFGWVIQEIPDMGYTMVSTGPTSDEGMPSETGYINGGMFDRASATPTGPVVTIAVESIDETLKKTKRSRRSMGSVGRPSMSGRRSVTWASPRTSRTPRAI